MFKDKHIKGDYSNSVTALNYTSYFPQDDFDKDYLKLILIIHGIYLICLVRGVN